MAFIFKTKCIFDIDNSAKSLLESCFELLSFFKQHVSLT